MAIDALDFPELHDESIPYMAFLKNCTRLLASAGVRDFNMQVDPLLRFALSRVLCSSSCMCRLPGMVSQPQAASHRTQIMTSHM